jgi:hypothetical protein
VSGKGLNGGMLTTCKSDEKQTFERKKEWRIRLITNVIAIAFVINGL